MDILEGVLNLISLVQYWRAVLCLAASGVLAAILVLLIPWLTVIQGILLAALGFIPAAAWEVSANPSVRPENSTPAQTTLPVSCAAAVICGATWGFFSSTSRHAFFAGGIILAVGAFVWWMYAEELNPPLPMKRRSLCIGLAVLAYPLAALVGHHLLK